MIDVHFFLASAPPTFPVARVNLWKKCISLRVDLLMTIPVSFRTVLSKACIWMVRRKLTVGARQKRSRQLDQIERNTVINFLATHQHSIDKRTPRHFTSCYRKHLQIVLRDEVAVSSSLSQKIKAEEITVIWEQTEIVVAIGDQRYVSPSVLWCVTVGIKSESLQLAWPSLRKRHSLAKLSGIHQREIFILPSIVAAEKKPHADEQPG